MYIPRSDSPTFLWLFCDFIRKVYIDFVQLCFAVRSFSQAVLFVNLQIFLVLIAEQIAFNDVAKVAISRRMSIMALFKIGFKYLKYVRLLKQGLWYSPDFGIVSLVFSSSSSKKMTSEHQLSKRLPGSAPEIGCSSFTEVIDGGTCMSCSKIWDITDNWK